MNRRSKDLWGKIVLDDPMLHFRVEAPAFLARQFAESMEVLPRFRPRKVYLTFDFFPKTGHVILCSVVTKNSISGSGCTTKDFRTEAIRFGKEMAKIYLERLLASGDIVITNGNQSIGGRWA